MLQRMSDQHKIKFLEEKQSAASGEPSRLEDSVKSIEETADEQKEKKLSNKDDGLKTDKHIRSAASGVIKDDKSSYSYTSKLNSNSIFNPNRIDDIIGTEDNKTKTLKEHEQIQNIRKAEKQKRTDEMVDLLKKTDQTKGDAVSLSGLFSGTNYKMPKNNMSIFDSEDFERTAEKTEGEIVSEDNKKRNSQKDESWKEGKQTVSSKDLVSDFFNNLLNKTE